MGTDVLTRKHLALFWLIVCLPLVVLSGVGWRLARNEHDMARQRLRELLLVRLRDVAQVIEDVFEQREREFQALTDLLNRDPVSIRQLIRREPGVAQLVWLHPDGTLLHPDPGGDLNAAERQFLIDFGDLFLADELLLKAAAGQEAAAAPASGWIVRFQGPGLNLLYARRMPSGGVAGILMPRARWMADLIAQLPNTTESGSRTSWDGRIRLVDSNGRPIYEWGSFEPAPDAMPLTELAPEYPLSSWRLQHFVDDAAFAAVGQGAYFNLLSILAATGLVLVVAGAWFYREYNRQVREALQRVSFVNQVSHELKTPLTNIRMYAELLESDLDQTPDDEAEAPREHVKVIVEESQRLSRLIGNVLTFAQHQRDGLTLRRRPAVVDDVIFTVLQRFEPALQRRGVEVAFERAAGALVELDVDALEQVLGNLLSNVEKYAPSGKRVAVSSRQKDDYTSIVVSDEGPGIPARHRARIFRPFQRLSNHIADSPGTGIGLTIARQLARLHGGDLALLSSEGGARFEVRLHTPSTESEATA